MSAIIKSENAQTGDRFRHLRETLKIPRVPFALLIRMGHQNLEAKEAGRAAFRAEEIERIKAATRAHILVSASTWEQTFADPLHSHTAACPLPFIKMKLRQPITDRHREQLSSLLETLKATPAALKKTSDEYYAARRKSEACDTELAKLLESGDASAKKADRLNTLQTQTGLLQRQAEQALAIYRKAHGEGEAELHKAARWIGQVAQPLLDQLRDELTQAITPYFDAPSASVQTFLGNTDAYRALNRFLGESGFMAQRSFTTQELIDHVNRWAGIVEAVLNGGEIWSYKTDSLAAAA